MCNWVDQAVFYHIYPLGFCGAPYQNEKNETINRIQKITEWIPHLKELNINALYLGPVFESSEHGYDTSDYAQIDRRLGSNDDFKKVCDELHQNGIRIVLDGVFNHVGRNFWAFQDVLEKGSESHYCGWFENLNFGGSSPMGDPFWYEGWEGHYNLVKLNLKNPEVIDHILWAVSEWIDYFQIDGLRLDVAYCLDFDFIKRLRQHCKSKKSDFWLMGEVVHGDYSRWANPDMLDSITNYECYKGLYSSHNDKNYFELGHSFNRLFGTGGLIQNIKTYNFVDNHDVNRIASVCRDERHLFNIFTALFTMPGCPSIYYGSEWSIKGEKNGGDAPLRPCLSLCEMQDTALTQHIAALAKIKQTYTSLQNGSYEHLILKNKEFLFKRSYNNISIFVALNIEDTEAVFTIQTEGAGILYDILHQEEFVCNENAVITVPSCSARILINKEFLIADRTQAITIDADASAQIPAELKTYVTPAQMHSETKNRFLNSLLTEINVDSDFSSMTFLCRDSITDAIIGQIICKDVIELNSIMYKKPPILIKELNLNEQTLSMKSDDYHIFVTCRKITIS